MTPAPASRTGRARVSMWHRCRIRHHNQRNLQRRIQGLLCSSGSTSRRDVQGYDSRGWLRVTKDTYCSLLPPAADNFVRLARFSKMCAIYWRDIQYIAPKEPIESRVSALKLRVQIEFPQWKLLRAARQTGLELNFGSSTAGGTRCKSISITFNSNAVK